MPRKNDNYGGVKEWRARNPEKWNAQTVRYRAKHKEAVHAYNRWYWLKKNYGLTREEFENMAAAQNGVCRVCERFVDPLHVDHDHTTARVRGLLCGSCNRALGLLGEDPLRVKSLLSYVRSWGG